MHWTVPGCLEFYLNLNPELQKGMVDCYFNQLIIYVTINWNQSLQMWKDITQIQLYIENFTYDKQTMQKCEIAWNGCGSYLSWERKSARLNDYRICWVGCFVFCSPQEKILCCDLYNKNLHLLELVLINSITLFSF